MRNLNEILEFLQENPQGMKELTLTERVEFLTATLSEHIAITDKLRASLTLNIIANQMSDGTIRQLVLKVKELEAKLAKLDVSAYN
jgi:hypothetical protein